MEPTPEPLTTSEPHAAPPAGALAIPPPPPTPAAPAMATPRFLVPRRPERAGELTPGWSTAFWVSWAAVIAGFAAIWYSSRVTGFATWWLGPETEPRFPLLSLLPFVAPLALCLLALSHVRWVPWFGLVGSVVTAAVGIGDLGVVDGYATAELMLAGGGLLVSLASFAGLLRAAEPGPAQPVTTAPTSETGSGTATDAPTEATTR